MIQQEEIISLIEAQHLVDKYQSSLQAIQQERRKLQQQKQEDKLHEKQTKSTVEFRRLQQKHCNNIHFIEDTLKKAIALSQSVVKKERELRIIQSNIDLVTHENNLKIETLTDEIFFLREKVTQSGEHGQKLSSQLIDLQQKMHTIDKFYQDQRKKIVSGYIEEQTNHQNGQQHLVRELKQNNENLSRLLNFAKKEQSDQQLTMSELRQKVETLTKQLNKLETKHQWQMQKKQQISQQLIQKLQLVEHMQSEIDELRDVLRNPFERLQPSQQDFDYEYVDQPQPVSVYQIRKNSSKDDDKLIKFSEDAPDYKNNDFDYNDVTGSFVDKLSQMGVKLDSVPNSYEYRNNRDGKTSVDKISSQKPKSNNIDRDSQQNREQDMSRICKKESENDQGTRSNTKSIKSKALSIGTIGIVGVNKKRSFNQIEDQKCLSVLNNRKSQGNQHKKSFQLDVSQTNKSQLKTKTNNYKKTPIILDPYYSHFILTSQAVKIRQDCEDLLNIDVKPFYKEIIEKRVPMHLWDQWLRNKLKQIVKENSAAH